MQAEELVMLVQTVQKQRCETQTIEVKSAHKGCPSRLYDTLSSFSNQDSGGILLFGLDETNGYEVVGVYDPQDLQRRVAEQCKQMEPVVRPAVYCDRHRRKNDCISRDTRGRPGGTSCIL